jgi:ABC-type amino acid transport substrate-binding protein
MLVVAFLLVAALAAALAAAALEADLAFADCATAMLAEAAAATVLPGARDELLRWLGGVVDICSCVDLLLQGGEEVQVHNTHTTHTPTGIQASKVRIKVP